MEGDSSKNDGEAAMAGVSGSNLEDAGSFHLKEENASRERMRRPWLTREVNNQKLWGFVGKIKVPKENQNRSSSVIFFKENTNAELCINGYV